MIAIPRAAPRRQSARLWLASVLTDLGIVSASLLREYGSEDGHSWRTIERAKQDLGVHSQRLQTGWFWTRGAQAPYSHVCPSCGEEHTP